MLRLLPTRFERRLRHTARRELRQSPAAWPEFKRRTRWNWFYTVGKLVVAGLLPIGLIFYSCIALLPVLGFSALLGRGLAADSRSAALILAMNSWLLTGVVVAIAGFRNRAYFAFGNSRQPVLFARWNPLLASHLPITDASILRSCIPDAAFGAVLSVIFCAAPYAVVLSMAGLSAGEQWGAWALCCLQVCTSAAACILAYGFSPWNETSQSLLRIAALLLLVGGLLVGVSLRFLSDDLRTAIEYGLYFSPLGWVNAAFLHGLLGHRLVGWLWLPLAELLIIAGLVALRAQVRAGFSLKEFVISPVNGSWYGVVEKGFRVPTVRPPLPLSFLVEKRKEASPAESIAISAMDVSSTLVDRTPSKSDWLGHIAQRFLTRRERLLMSLWTTSLDRLGAQSRSFYLCIALVTIVIYFGLSRALVAGKDDAVLFAILWPMVAWVCGRLTCSVTLMGRANLLILYPVTLSELLRARIKQELIRSIVFTPGLLAYAFATAHSTGQSPWKCSATACSSWPCGYVGSRSPTVFDSPALRTIHARSCIGCIGSLEEDCSAHPP